MITNMVSLTLADGKPTPENHIYSPASNGADGVARWQDREHNNGISLGFSTLTFSVREPIKPGGVTRVKVSLSIPKLDTTTVVPTVTGVGQANLEFIFPGSFTLQDRADLRALFVGISGAAVLGDNIVHMQRPY